ncbi:MAG: cyclic-di-AMP receptor [Clostridia bacterium]|nr:cyclic-di-AMP receptor [Clostridia bacterium]MBR6745198.1 cyclic-di-AMP receptor [Clostridia bacterium]
MKLIIAIVNNDDAHFVNTGLTSEGFQVTKVSSTGGFLLNGNSTFFVGVDDNRVGRAVEIIKAHSKKRVKSIPFSSVSGTTDAVAPANADICIGGATLFIMDVEKFMHF